MCLIKALVSTEMYICSLINSVVINYINKSSIALFTSPGGNYLVINENTWNQYCFLVLKVNSHLQIWVEISFSPHTQTHNVPINSQQGPHMEYALVEEATIPVSFPPTNMFQEVFYYKTSCNKFRAFTKKYSLIIFFPEDNISGLQH